ncbi:DUF1659 domain-containing protein [Indiicoccus explosivorum]|uniref:DUF1659 domain-containing protein n=1 Tax=Indiicoccus explosivorum TaxID=1917864 RepID=UPI00138FED4D|nr:DUF1659 domain-containing protein [Indiicoccus explosivorum]
MAVSEFSEAVLRVTLDDGVDENGKQKKKVKAYRHASETATPDSMSQSAQLLAGFGTKPLISVEKQTVHNIYA